MIKTKVKVDLKGVIPKTEKINKKKQYALDAQVAKDGNYYIPFDTGALRDSVFQNGTFGEGKIIWGGKGIPYAKRLYYNSGYNFSKDANPNAGSHWFERAKSAHLKHWISIVE